MDEKPTKNVRQNKRIKKLIFISAITAVVLIVSTYAWFVGLQSVNVDSFEVEVAAADSLMLSLDGNDWKDTIKFTSTELEGGAATGESNVSAYAGNTNNWPSKGLVPISSIGDMDSTVSRMKMYEKASFTTTPGGFRLLASRVNNYGAPEIEGVKIQDGYVAFDLFVKNYSGTQYIQTLDELDEEALYLTTDSSVNVALNGVAGTGIENSVRLGFAQIGRVNGFNSNQTAITGMTCNSSPDTEKTSLDYVTGICRTAQIWEPNDTKHVQAAIDWYQKACLPRIGANVTLTESYDQTEGVKCGAVADGTAYRTYAISDDVKAIDNVDVYDGADYNGYTEGSNKLISYDYFTDTEKMLTGTQRPSFMTLAPNSITKIRVYVYIEGQDIDNYDFAQIGRQIQVKFGFTKERFTEADINYTGPELNPTPTP